MRNVSKIWGITSNENSLLDHVSFMCVRTNPKLSTNVRLVTNGKKIWLDSYSATKELSENHYKAFGVENGLYNKDVAKFYKGLDYNIPYTVYQGYDDTTVKTAYDSQYETFYWCGTEYVSSLEYDEEFGITAPIWLDKKIPSLFVVFRVSGPSYENLLELEKSGKKPSELNFREDILNKCEIIKTFDLTENSKFGSYIRRYFNQDDFPQEPLHATLGVGEGCTYKGFSIVNGSLVSVPEYNRDRFFNDDETVIGTDDFITRGFERNKIACANLLNIEFLFDDNGVENYTLNRYFGLYCNFVEDGEYKLDFSGFGELVQHGNTPVPQGGNVLFSKTPVVVENQDGVLLPFADAHQQNGLFPYGNIVNSLDSVFCVLDKNGDLHNLNNGLAYQSQTDKIARMSEARVDITSLTGFVTNGRYIDVERGTGGLCAQVEITIHSEIPLGASFSIKKKVQGGLEDVCDVVCDYSYNGQVAGHTPGWHNQNRFCGRGTASQVALALTGAINAASPDDFVAFCINNKVVVQSKLANSEANKFVLIPSVVQNGEVVPSMQYIGNILDVLGNEENGCWGFCGGTENDHIRVSEENAGYFVEGNWLKTTTKKGWGQIKSVVVDYSTLSVAKNGVTKPKKEKVWYNVTLDEDGVMVSNNSQVAVYSEYVPKFGRLSFFPVRDFDFSTYENPSIYGDLGELEEEYKEIGVEPEQESSESQTERGNGKTTVSFQIGQKNVVADIFFGSNINVVQNGTPSVEDAGNGEYWVTVGVDILSNTYEQSTTQINRYGFSFESLCTMLFGKKEQIGNEYDMYLENYSKDYMLLSKTVPYVSKWVYHENSLDVREKPYRLNTNMAFGVNSFSPNPYNIEPKTDDFNQEWEYILEKYPFGYDTASKSWSYLDIYDAGNIENTNLSDFEYGGDTLEDLLRSTETNYFDILFVQDFMRNGQDVYDHLEYKRKYSVFEKGSNLTNSETFFRGVKVELLQKVNYDEEVNNNIDNLLLEHNSDINGYKFAVVAVPYIVNYKEGLNKRGIKVIRNDKFGFVVVLVYTAKKIYGAADFLGNASQAQRTQSLNYKKLSRYFMYNPETCINEQDNPNIRLYPQLSIFGTGMISQIERVQGETDTYNVYGRNTSFLTDFDFATRGTDNGNVSNEFVLLKYLVANSDEQLNILPNHEQYIIMEGFEVKEIKTDTHLVAIKKMQACSAFANSGFSQTTSNNLEENNITDGMFVVLNKSKYALSDEINKCTFGNIYYNINHFQKGNVVYEHVAMENGEWKTLSSERNEWSYALKIIPPELYAKYCHKKLLCDNKHIYYDTKPTYAVQISRQSGYYMPLFRDVLYFKDPFVKEALANENNPVVGFLKNSRYCNTVFACNYDGFGTIRVLNFHRANETNNNVFRLFDGEQPLLPIQNKFTVGKREYNVFNSSWDPWYFTETNSEIQETDIHGTACMEEKSAMLGSKCMKTPDGFLFETFVCKEVVGDKKVVGEVLYSVEKGKALFKINVKEKLLKLFADNLWDLFDGFVDKKYSYGDKTTVEDDIVEYATRNLLPLYQIENVALYVKSANSGETSVDVTNMVRNNREKVKAGLSPEKNVLSVYGNTDDLVGELAYNLVGGKTYWFGLSVTVSKK